jgi:hypothetical protein
MNISNRKHLLTRQFTLRPKLEIGQTLLIRVMRMPNVFTPAAIARTNTPANKTKAAKTPGLTIRK